MKKLIFVIPLVFFLGACAQLQTALNDIQATYTFATTTTVPANQVGIVANAFDGLKATAINYGNYCVAQKFPQPVCSAANRRVIIKAINAGSAARLQLEAAISNGQPATATVYNALVAAVQALQNSAAQTAQAQGVIK